MDHRQSSSKYSMFWVLVTFLDNHVMSFLLFPKSTARFVLQPHTSLFLLCILRLLIMSLKEITSQIDIYILSRRGNSKKKIDNWYLVKEIWTQHSEWLMIAVMERFGFSLFLEFQKQSFFQKFIPTSLLKKFRLFNKIICGYLLLNQRKDRRHLSNRGETSYTWLCS